MTTAESKRAIRRTLVAGVILITAVVPTTAVPSAPANLVAQVTGSTVTLTWTAPAGTVIGYVLEAGSGSGLSDLARVTLGPTASFVAMGVAPGIYFIRVRAVDATGQGASSNEAMVSVSGGGCTAAPNPPAGLTAAVNGMVVTVNWFAAGGCPATNFALHAGTGPGSSNVAIVNLGLSTSLTASAPPGTYFLRVFAQNAYGTSAASNEAIVQVGAPTLPNVTGTWTLTRTGNYPWIAQFNTLTVTLVQSGTTLSGSILPVGRTTATRFQTGSRILADGRVFFGSEGPFNYWNDVTDAYFTMTLDPTRTRMTGTCNLIFTCTSATAVKIR